MASMDSDERAPSLNIAEANNYLGLNLYKLLSEEKGNVFFSPFSLSAAFAMLFHAAEKETAEEMRNVLGYKFANVEDQELKLSYKNLLDEIERSSNSYTLTTANSVVSQNKFQYREEYRSLLTDFFKAYLWEVNFSGDLGRSIQLINEWVSGKTQKMIPKLLKTLSPVTILVLLNAVYFKGFWQNQFNKKKTTLKKFNIRGEESFKKVEMMHITETFPFSEVDSYKVLELPYKGGEMSMLILLPKLPNGLKNLESSLSNGFLQDLKQKMWATKVSVAIPKFKIDYPKSLKMAFESLGVRKLFRTDAELGGLCEMAEGLCASDVIHQAVIEVNEEGSEAAAATAIPIGRSLCSRITPEFIADHPFMFIIYNTKNNLIFFMGKVEEL